MDHRNEIAALLASLADPSRLRVLGVLAEGDYCVTEVAVRVGLSQSCTTRHLQTLQRAGVLNRVRDGKRVRFRIRRDDPAIERLVEFVLLRQARPLPATADPGGASVHAPRPPAMHVAVQRRAAPARPLATVTPLRAAVPDMTVAGTPATDGVTIAPLHAAPPAAGPGDAVATTVTAEAPGDDSPASAPELEDYLL